MNTIAVFASGDSILLLELLKEKVKTGRFSRRDGICKMADELEAACRAILRQIFMKWGKFSGSLSFPVPSPVASVTSDIYYFAPDDMWDKESEDPNFAAYARDRWELLEFVMDYLSNSVEEVVSWEEMKRRANHVSW